MGRDRIYFLAPTRAGGWTVRPVIEHGRYHETRPRSWRGPYASELDAQHAALALHREADPHCTCNDCIAFASQPAPEDAGPFIIEFPTMEDARAAAEDIHTRTGVIVAIERQPSYAPYAALLDLVQTVAMGNTDADNLTRMASNVLAGKHWSDGQDTE